MARGTKCVERTGSVNLRWESKQSCRNKKRKERKNVSRSVVVQFYVYLQRKELYHAIWWSVCVLFLFWLTRNSRNCGSRITIKDARERNRVWKPKNYSSSRENDFLYYKLGICKPKTSFEFTKFLAPYPFPGKRLSTHLKK